MNSPRVTIFCATAYSVPEAAQGTSVAHGISAGRSSADLYYNRNRIAFAQEKGDDVLEDPITMEEMPSYIPGKTISYLRLSGLCPVGMRFFTLSSLQQCLQRNNKDPFTNLPWKGAMRRRVEIAAKVSAQAEQPAQDAPTLFQEFIQNPAAFKARHEYAWLEHNLHIGDAGILSWTDSMRDKAIQTLETAPLGAWLIRNSSLKSTDLVTVQAISYVRTQATIHIPAKISHLLVMHVRGYGYAIAEAARGQLLPDSTTKDVPLPEHDGVHGSFIEIMEWLHEHAENFDIRNMIVA
jgi:hypothetical protein